MRRPVRAIARRRNGLGWGLPCSNAVESLGKELPGHFGNTASVRAGRRTAGGSLTTGPRWCGGGPAAPG
ncbi:hypothetical protein CVT27_05600 [Streptomyces cavourensis]|nr:hypothetical protein CVT27_05600 [Streptomyces cavourensis]